MIDIYDPPEVPALDIFSFYAHLNLISVMEPETETLMQERALKQLQEDDFDSPHSRPWFVSFHASEYPGDTADACERYLLYRMMNIPAREAMPPWVTATGVVGKAGELDIADAWFQGGRMLAIPESEDDRAGRLGVIAKLIKAGRHDEAQELAEAPPYHQLGFVDPNTWMTASTDLPILPKGWRRPYIVEVKGKADEVLQEMLTGIRKDGTRAPALRQPDKPHIRQIKATLGAAAEYDWGWVTVCSSCWFIVAAEVFERLGLPSGLHPLSDAFGICPRCKDYKTEHFQLEPPINGEIYYWSRSWPRTTKSFYIELDPAFYARGRDVLAQTREHFIMGRLPERRSHMQWSVGPCGQCRFKPACRLDFGLETPRKRKPTMDPVVKLDQSHAIQQALAVRPRYDYEAVRARVFEEWS